MILSADGKLMDYNLFPLFLYIFFISRQIALKALSERLKATDSTRHTQLPKSFPQQQQLQQHHHHQNQHDQHQHHHQHQQQHKQHSHSHGPNHGHSHGHSHGHPAGAGASAAPQPDFVKPAAQQLQPITTAHAEPRMISTMSPIAIPMPAPPPKEEKQTNETLIQFDTESN